MNIRGRTISVILIAAFMLLGAICSSNAEGGSVRETLDRLYQHVPGSQGLVARSAGVLVFPTVVKAGFGIGGEYGEGELLIGGIPAGRYNTVAGSIGFQLGAEARSVIIIFMTPYALDEFRRIDGWKVGVDGSVAIITVGVGGSIDTEKITSPVVGFILDPKGLMYNLTLEGSKISRIR
jgi:lipid-binding SYLF domain-containing protein